MKNSIQLGVALLCLLGLANAALDPQQKAKLNQEVKVLMEQRQDIAKRYVSAKSFSSRVLNRGLALVEQMEEIVQEYGLEQEFPSVAQFVESLKIFAEEIKDFTSEHMNTLADEFWDKDEKIKLWLALIKMNDKK